MLHFAIVMFNIQEMMGTNLLASLNNKAEANLTKNIQLKMVFFKEMHT